jgi:hypothetical protein
MKKCILDIVYLSSWYECHLDNNNQKEKEETAAAVSQSEEATHP